MKAAPSFPSTSTYVPPASCPTCQSSSIGTTAKVPNAESYSRCTNCGDIWNASRLQIRRPGRYSR